MLLDLVKKGSVDRSIVLKIIDSTDGTPETGVVFNTSGIDLWYRREGAAVVSITEATLAALTTAHADGGFLTIGHGLYRFDIPDAAFATGANYVDFGGTVTGMVVIGGRVRLIDFDLEDTVRGGLTALPNAAAEAAGGLYTRGTGAGQLNQPANGQVDVNVEKWNATAVPAEHTAGYPIVTVKDGAGTGEINTNAGKVVGVELVDTITTYTANTPQTGDAYAAAIAVQSRLSSVVTKTGTVATDGGNNATTFVTSLTESSNDYWKDSFLKITSGALINQVKKITGYNGTTKAVTLASALTGTPADAVTFEIIND